MDDSLFVLKVKFFFKEEFLLGFLRSLDSSLLSSNEISLSES